MSSPSLPSPEVDTPTPKLEAFRASLSSFSYSPSSPNPNPNGARRSPRLLAFQPTTSSGPSTPSSSNKRPPPLAKDESPTKPKKRNTSPLKRGYAEPEKYAHYAPLEDYLAPGLDVLFCGINPGIQSAQTGHHFANPSNHFWRALHQGGLVPRFVPPSEDSTLPALYNLGMTNLVERTTAEAAELSAKEMAQGVGGLLGKVRAGRPRVVCFVGKGIWGVVRKSLEGMGRGGVAVERMGEAQDGDELAPPAGEEPAPTTTASKSTKSKDAFEYGLQPYVLLLPPEPVALPLSACQPEGTKVEPDFADNRSMTTVKTEEPTSFLDPVPTGIEHTLIWVMPSTSGRVVSHQLVDKIKLFAQLKRDVEAAKTGALDLSGWRRIRI